MFLMIQLIMCQFICLLIKRSLKPSLLLGLQEKIKKRSGFNWPFSATLLGQSEPYDVTMQRPDVEQKAKPALFRNDFKSVS